MSPQAELKAEELYPRVVGVADRALRSKTAATLLAEVEVGRLPSIAQVALGAIEVPLEHGSRQDYVLKALGSSELAPALGAACPGQGERALSELANKTDPPRKKTMVVYRECGLAKSPLSVPATDVGQEADVIMLAHVLFAYFTQQGGIADVEHKLLRILAGGLTLPEPPFSAADLAAQP